MFSIVSYIEPDEETTVLYGIHGCFNSKQEANDFLNKIRKTFNKNNSDKIIDIYKFKDYLTVVMLCKTEFTDEECVAINFKIKEINTSEKEKGCVTVTVSMIFQQACWLVIKEIRYFQSVVVVERELYPTKGFINHIRMDCN